MERRAYEGWAADGSKDMAQRVHEKMIEILESHAPEALSDDVLKQLDDIVAAAEARVSK